MSDSHKVSFHTLEGITCAQLVSVGSYDARSNLLSGTVKKTWGFTDDDQLTKQVSLWQDGPRLYGSDTSRDFKFGEQIILIESSPGIFETFLPALDFQKKLHVFFEHGFIPRFVASMDVDQLKIWYQDRDVGELFLEEGMKAGKIPFDDWLPILSASDGERADVFFDRYWDSLLTPQKKMMASKISEFILRDGEIRWKLYQTLMKEMVRTNDAFYIVQIKHLLNDPHFFNSTEPVAMKLVIVLGLMTEMDRSFLPYLKNFYEICRMNGISIMKSEEQKIKDLLR